MESLSDYAVLAAAVVERVFPPVTLRETYQVVAALNLLNAIVKQPEGNVLTSYYYIKGMAACLFLWLLYHPKEGVRIYWDEDEDVAYFRVGGRQFSFHHVPLLDCYVDKMNEMGLESQEWDGLRLQLIGRELFDEAVVNRPSVDEETKELLLKRMCGYGPWQLRARVHSMKNVENRAYLPMEKPSVCQRRRIAQALVSCQPSQTCFDRSSFCERRLCLETALKFNIWRSNSFELRRRDDCWTVRAVRYTGHNYKQLLHTIVHDNQKIRTRNKRSLRKGRLYHLQRIDRRWCCISPSRHLLLLAYYNYLKVGQKYFNLCVTYGIACYLAYRFPTLRFINVLNYTRMNHRRYCYSYGALMRISPHSKARQLKVWIVVDRAYALERLDVDSIPEPLVNAYLMADDYCRFFEVREEDGAMGLFAYSRFWLLKPEWPCIKLQGRYAQVMNHQHKWAVYSLLQECFASDFLYNSIWLDCERDMVVGRIGKQVVDIHELYR